MNKDLYLFVLDFNTSRVHRYELSRKLFDRTYGITDSGIIEGFMIGKGHSLSNCEWMTTENPELEY